jgi:hypothetical protein
MFRQTRIKRLGVGLAVCALLLASAAPALAVKNAYFHSNTGPGPGVVDLVLFGAPGNWVTLAYEIPPNGVYAVGYQDLVTSSSGQSFLSVSTGIYTSPTGPSGVSLVVFQSSNLPPTWGPATATVSIFDLTTGQFLGGTTADGRGYLQN